MKKENQQSDIVIYTTDDGQARIQVKIKDETVWLTQKQMAELFQCSTDNVGLHLKNIFKGGELSENSVAEEYSVTASDGSELRVCCAILDGEENILSPPRCLFIFLRYFPTVKTVGYLLSSVSQILRNHKRGRLCYFNKINPCNP